MNMPNHLTRDISESGVEPIKQILRRHLRVEPSGFDLMETLSVERLQTDIRRRYMGTVQ